MSIHPSRAAYSATQAARLCPECRSTKVLSTDVLSEVATVLPEEVADLYAEYRFYCLNCHAVFDERSTD